MHWLRVRAQKMRYEEEFDLCQSEMGWTVRFYIHMTTLWRSRRDLALNSDGRYWSIAQTDQLIHLVQISTTDQVFQPMQVQRWQCGMSWEEPLMDVS